MLAAARSTRGFDLFTDKTDRGNRISRCFKFNFVQYFAAKFRHSDLRMSDAEIQSDEVIVTIGEREHLRSTAERTGFEHVFAKQPAVDERLYIFGDCTLVDLKPLNDLGAADRLRGPYQPEERPSFCSEVEVTVAN